MNTQDAELEAWLASNPAFVLGVTGSRGWARRRSVWVPLNRMLSHHRRLIVRNGKAKKGVDSHVSDWTALFPDHIVQEDPHPARWDLYGSQAGFRRNQEMVDAGMDALMAWALPCDQRKPWCPPGEHPTHGTFDCVEKARAAGITVHFSPEGMSW